MVQKYQLVRIKRGKIVLNRSNRIPDGDVVGGVGMEKNPMKSWNEWVGEG